MSIKVGDTVTMYFHMIGLTSEETFAVVEVTDDTVTLENEKIFSRKTGRCLNDDNAFGASRTIRPVDKVTP